MWLTNTESLLSTFWADMKSAIICFPSTFFVGGSMNHWQWALINFDCGWHNGSFYLMIPIRSSNQRVFFNLFLSLGCLLWQKKCGCEASLFIAINIHISLFWCSLKDLIPKKLYGFKLQLYNVLNLDLGRSTKLYNYSVCEACKQLNAFIRSDW